MAFDFKKKYKEYYMPQTADCACSQGKFYYRSRKRRSKRRGRTYQQAVSILYST